MHEEQDRPTDPHRKSRNRSEVTYGSLAHEKIWPLKLVLEMINSSIPGGGVTGWPHVKKG